MIGRLLQTAASSFSQHASSRPQTSLESVTEETHTRDLLFPDIIVLRASQQNALPSHSSRMPATAKEAVNHDDNGGLDIAYPNDIRIIIAQDANSRHHQPQVLYDSRPSKDCSNVESLQKECSVASSQRLSTRGKSLTNPSLQPSGRHQTTNSSIFSSSQTLPKSPVSLLSPGSRFRCITGDSQARQTSFEQPLCNHDTQQSRVTTDTKEEIDALLGCMFGAPGFRLEPSTKVHVIPRNVDDLKSEHKSPGTPRPLSSSGFHRKRTPLTRSTSVADVTVGVPRSCETTDHNTHTNPRTSVMFTRLFSINLPDVNIPRAEGGVRKLGPHSGKDSSTSPDKDNRAHAQDGTVKSIKQTKAPMYAVAVILQLPLEKGDLRMRSSHSQQGLSSLGSSYNDVTTASSWRAEYSTFSSFMEARESASFDPITNTNISHLLHHSNILCRSMELLEISARSRLLDYLEQSIPLTPCIPPPSRRDASTKPKAVKLAIQQNICVIPGCLQNEPLIRKNAEIAAQRIVSGLRTRRVMTGQGRWGAWREEARWMGRWAGSREHNFFFFNILTAFLGSHTTWLQSLGPPWYRRRHAFQQCAQPKDENCLRQRTVIVATDKMAARRLIFLLAGFFPTPSINTQTPFPAKSQVALSYAESPPLEATGTEPSFRQPGSGKPGSVRQTATEGSGHKRSVSFSIRQKERRMGTKSPTIAVGHHRRGSDTKSIKGQSLPLPYQMHELQKSSISTTLADSTVPVPHFTNLSTKDLSFNTPNERPVSGGSLASIALSHNLMRSEGIMSSFSGSGGRWGSVASGFWSNHGDYSTDGSDDPGLSFDSLARGKGITEDQRVVHSENLERMLEQANIKGEGKPGKDAMQPRSIPSSLAIESCLKQDDPSHERSSAKIIPQRQMPERMPIKLSMNEDDGYVDISMAPNYSINSSLASSFASIKLPGAAPSPSHEHYSPYGSCMYDSFRQRLERPVDVAGWLEEYQPDFALQAVRPYDSLVDDIKASMRAESRLIPATSLEADLANGQWADVSVTLVVDTTRFTVERLRLRRRKKIGSYANHSCQAIMPDELEAFEEQLIKEQVMDMDATLIDAIERTLARSGDPSRAPSRASSPPRSSRTDSIYGGTGIRRSASALGLDTSELITGASGPELPHGECRKMVFGALEDVVKSVVAERDIEGNDRRKREPDSTLREGVRRWLIGIEGGVSEQRSLA